MSKKESPEELVEQASYPEDDYNPNSPKVVSSVIAICQIERARQDEIEKIIALAEGFECCPYCQNTKLESHFCPNCNRRFSLAQEVPDGFVALLRGRKCIGL